MRENVGNADLTHLKGNTLRLILLTYLQGTRLQYTLFSFSLFPSHPRSAILEWDRWASFWLRSHTFWCHYSNNDDPQQKRCNVHKKKDGQGYSWTTSTALWQKTTCGQKNMFYGTYSGKTRIRIQLLILWKKNHTKFCILAKIPFILE